jgi:hypothetical protein
MTHSESKIDVDVPVRTAYNQWTQFESFPAFMKGVKSVRQLADNRLQWVAEIGGRDVEWTAEITHQEPDRHIGWRSTSGAPNAGSVKFEPLGADRTRVIVRLDYTPEGPSRRPAARSASSRTASRPTWASSRSSSRPAAVRPAPGAAPSAKVTWRRAARAATWPRAATPPRNLIPDLTHDGS